MVVCGGSRGGGEDPSRLTPSHLLSGGGRAFTVLSGARQFEWRAVGKQMGGTLIVDDASHKEDVHKVGAGAGQALWVNCGATAAEASKCCRVPSAPAAAWTATHDCGCAALQAVRDGNLSFGFSAGGCLFPYYIGVAGALIDGGVLTGAWGGSWCWAQPCHRSLAPHMCILLLNRIQPAFVRYCQALLPTPKLVHRPRESGRRVCGVAAGRLPQERHAPGPNGGAKPVRERLHSMFLLLSCSPAAAAVLGSAAGLQVWRHCTSCNCWLYGCPAACRRLMHDLRQGGTRGRLGVRALLLHSCPHAWCSIARQLIPLCTWLLLCVPALHCGHAGQPVAAQLTLPLQSTNAQIGAGGAEQVSGGAPAGGCAHQVPAPGLRESREGLAAASVPTLCCVHHGNQFTSLLTHIHLLSS